MKEKLNFIKEKKWILAASIEAAVIVILAILLIVSCSKTDDEKAKSSVKATIDDETTVDDTTAEVDKTTADKTTEDDTTQENTTEESTTEKQTEKPTEAPTEPPTTLSTPANNNVSSGTPMAKYGKLKVTGTHLTNQAGQNVQLKGVSTHGLSWFPEYVTKETFKTFRDEWGVELIRLAMYTAEYNGYCSGGNKEELKQLVCKGVDYATELGMYVIIDWHILSDGNPQQNKEEAKAFFSYMSSKYASNTNVIYEICNEPNGGCSWDGDIKPYAEEVISVIRANDKDAVIIVGTPTWSQDVDVVARNPLPASCGNVMYALHYYAATHKENIQDKMVTAINAGLPIFVSEFGICDASGNGWNDTESANKWIQLLNKYDISFVAWNLSNKDEKAALISSWIGKTSSWSDDDLSESGKWFKYISK